jgi:hypothetical protein
MDKNNNKSYYNLYNTLLESGELYDMFPDMRGEWFLDKEKFIKAQERLEEELLDYDVEEDYEFYEEE